MSSYTFSEERFLFLLIATNNLIIAANNLKITLRYSISKLAKCKLSSHYCSFATLSRIPFRDSVITSKLKWTFSTYFKVTGSEIDRIVKRI